MSNERNAPLLQVANVTKEFGGVRAVDDVSLAVQAGSITAIVGENGAGKSTLVSIISGVIPHGTYSGGVQVNGQPAEFATVREAESAGVVLVPQELRIAPQLSLAENMFIGHLPTRRGLVDFDALIAKGREWLKFFGIDMDPRKPAGLLSPSEQRLAVIAGALSRQAGLLILDEPTAAVTDGEAQTLFAHIERLRERGLGVLFITHRLDEVDQVADRVLVMRNGALVDVLDEVRGNRERIVQSMIGRALVSERDGLSGPREGIGTDVTLRVRDFTVMDPIVPDKVRVDSASFELRRGEILGIYGLVGAGRTEMARAVFGNWDGDTTGHVEVAGTAGIPPNPRAAQRRGLFMVTEDRKTTGIIPGHSVKVNISSATLSKVSRFGWLVDNDREHDRNIDLMKRLDVRPLDPEYIINSLSGGNQQKVLLARALATNPRVLILDEPTLGVDVGARYEIYRLIREMADNGLSVLVISSDVEEAAAECDRVLVMYKGRFVAEFDGGAAHHDLVAAATGGNEK